MPSQGRLKLAGMLVLLASGADYGLVDLSPSTAGAVLAQKWSPPKRSDNKGALEQRQAGIGHCAVIVL
jgi:hypothetical protein